MTAYIIRRLLLTIPVLFGISIVVFFSLKLIPGDPAAAMLGAQARPEDIASLQETLGLNEPLPIQYGRWMGRTLQGDLGRSLEHREPVTKLLRERFTNTLILTVASVALSIAIGLPAGVISATRQYSVFDRGTMFLALFANSMPAFWLGLVLILIFSLNLGWFPVGGMYDPRGDREFFDLLHHLVLPAITLGGVTTALVARMTRSSMLEVIRQDYTRTARSKGLQERTVITRHALQNALLPVVTVIGTQFGFLLGGAVLTETVFSWPGVGQQLFRAILSRDIPLIQGTVLVIAVIFVMINLAVDILYAYLDPRIRYS